MRALLASVSVAVSVVGCSSGGDRPPLTDPLAVVQRAGLASGPSRAVLTLPHRSDGPTRVAPRSAPEAWVEISPEAIRSVAARDGASARVFPRAALDTDVVWLATAHGAEEARVLSTPRAPHTARHRLRVGPAIERLRLREGRIEAIDRSGAVAVASDPAFAVDARGARRAVSVSLEVDAGGGWMTTTLDAEGLAYPIVVDPAWTTVPSMAVARRDAAAATLSSGRVLIVGGSGASGGLTSVESYDPVANTWSTMTAAPIGGALVLLVPLAGEAALAVQGWSRHRYDASANTWSTAGTAAVFVQRVEATATRLNDGRVLLAGGDGTATAEVYDPVANGWSATGSLSGQRHAHAAALLADGRVMVAGGVREGSVLGDVEIFDPTAGAWSAGGALVAARYGATATRLPSGKVLIVGGRVGVNMTASAELFDPVTKTSTKTGSLAEPRTGHFAALLGDGRVLIAGGLYSSTNTEVWDPASGTWSSGGTLAQARAFFSGAALAGSRVLLAGGVGPLSTAELWTPQAAGAACAANGECANGACVDDVCCDKPCGAACESCKLAGKVGTCTAITGAPAHAGCGAYARCAAGSCATTCAADADCSAGHFCEAGRCVAGKVLAASCARDRECASGFCTDGACCDARCDGQCEACDVGLDKGRCVPVNGAPHGTRPACTGTGAGTECGVRCNGANRTACVIAGSTVTCSKNACKDGLETRVGVCNGAGGCSESPRSCGAYACGELTCNTLCKAKTDCAAGHYCNAGTCAPVEALGRECSGADTCASGFCTDGVCCGVAACPAGSTCSAKSHEGTCTKIDGQRCDSAAECGSGHCVDAVCCDSACSDPCAACDVPGSFGRCKAVKGAPHGVRAACPKDAGNPCASRACDGVTTASCAGLVAGEVTCREAKCEGGTVTEKASCDGSGSCPAAVTASCGGFACEPAAAACKVRCGKDEDCVATHVCREGACTPRTPICDPDGLAVIEVGGEQRACAPYVCRGGACLTTCATTSECVAGYTCDPGSRACVPSSGPVEESGGGCRIAGAPRAGGAWPLGVVALGALLARRRRWSLLFALALPGCGGSRATGADVTDAAVPLSSGRDVMQRLARIPGVSSLLSARATGGFGGSLHTQLEDGAPPRLAPRAAPDAWIEIRDEAQPAGPGEWVDGARVVRGADDQVWIPGASRLEDLRLLHAARDAAEIRQRLRLGPGIARIEVDEGRVLARDAAGTVRLAADAPFAIDASGKRRLGAVSLAPEGDEHLLIIHWSLEGCAFPVVLDPAWSTIPSMKRVRYEHGAARMRSGRVLVVGGRDALGGYHTQAEVYDPIANDWTLLAGGGQVINPAMAVAEDGKVVVEGWPTSSVFDPSTNTWTETADVTKARSQAIAVAVAPTRVLIAGGQQTSVFSSAEVLDTTTRVRTPLAATMTAARAAFGAVRLTDGRVLLAGGVGATADLSSAELFDPTTSTFTATGSMTTAHRLLTLLRLPSGKVLAVDATSAELFDPATGTWSAAGTFARRDRGAYLLDGGWALTVGGPGFAPKTSTDAWDPVSNAWYAAGTMAVARTDHAGVALPDGTVLVTGGRDPEPTATAEVFSRLFDGASCGGRGECRSGFCADGRCCNTACSGPCQACDAPSAPGTCTGISGPPKHGDCGAYASCASGACVATCATNADCASTHRCVSSACVPKLANGATCAAASDCAGGFCVDGVCCNRACTAQCESCAETGSVGTCQNRVGAPIGGRPACASGDPACGPRCDGMTATHCVPAWDGAPCSEDKCVDGIESHFSVCDGKGLCKDVKKACGAYACGVARCNPGCVLKTDCAAGFVCTDGKCVAQSGLGKACLSAETCASGFCTDGVCCGVASCGDGRSCATAAARGRCAKSNGQTCAADAECGSGACVDGVCCESRCGGQCEACDVAGFLGECRPIKGPPRTGRPACAAGTDVCSATSCDGVRVDECAAFAPEDTACRAQSCADGVATRPAKCDGKGACPAVLTSPCNGYGCDPTTSDCRTSCAADADCFGDFRCLDSKCVRRGARCSPDGTSLVSVDGVSASCSPYVCANDACRTKCGTTGDCQSGFICDPGSLACVAPAGATEDSGGGCAVARAPGGAPSWLAALLALGLARRRRR